MPCGGVRAPKVIFACRKSFLPSFPRAGALWRGQGPKKWFSLAENRFYHLLSELAPCGGFFSLAENRFYNLLPEPVPYGGVSAPKSDFRLPKIVVYNLPPEPGVILGLKGSRIIGLQGRML